MCNRLKSLYINCLVELIGIILNFKFVTNRHFALSNFDWNLKMSQKKTESQCCNSVFILAKQTEEPNWLTVI